MPETNPGFITTFWRLTAEMAPYLLIGFAVAGLLHVIVHPKWIERHLGKRGLRQIFKASVIGAPLPLCSCGIIPVAATVRQLGGSRGSVASFTAATPQTGVDSIIATGGLISWPFAAVRVIVAVISGTVCGWLVERFEGKEMNSPHPAPEQPATCCHGGDENVPRVSPQKQSGGEKFAAAVRYGFLKLPSELYRALFVGLILAAIITSLLPRGWIGTHIESAGIQYLLALMSGLPLYVCSTGSIPLALSLIASGLTPGAALIFLIVGPATNIATLVALPKIIGTRATVSYIAGLVVISILAAIVIDGFGWSIVGTVEPMTMGSTVWKQIAAIIFLAILLIPAWKALRPEPSESKSECCHE